MTERERLTLQSARALIFTHFVGVDCRVIDTAHNVADSIMRDLAASGFTIIRTVGENVSEPEP